MEILEAYDLTGSFRSTAALCGVDHHTVRRYVAARAAGLDPAASVRPPGDRRSVRRQDHRVGRALGGRVRADVVHRKLAAMGFVGSERTTRRVVAQLKSDYVRSTHRIYKPWVTEPGMWLQFDYGKGPIVGGRPPRCFARGWPGRASGWSSHWRTRRSPRGVGPRPDVAGHRGCADLSVDRQREDGDHPSCGRSGSAQSRDPRRRPLLRGRPSTPAWWPIPSPKAAPRRRCASPRPTCCLVPTTWWGIIATSPRSRRPVPRRPSGSTPGSTERPASDPSTVWRSKQACIAIPPEPYTVAFGETRTVSWSSLISFQGSALLGPPPACARRWSSCRRHGDEVVIVATGPDGAKEVARHPVAAKARSTLRDEHYPPDAAHPERRPQAANNQPRPSSSPSAKEPGVTWQRCGHRGPPARRAHGRSDRPGRAVDAGILDEALGLGRFGRSVRRRRSCLDSRRSTRTAPAHRPKTTPFSPAPSLGPPRKSEREHRRLRRGGRIGPATSSALSAPGGSRA